MHYKYLNWERFTHHMFSKAELDSLVEQTREDTIDEIKNKSNCQNVWCDQCAMWVMGEEKICCLLDKLKERGE